MDGTRTGDFFSREIPVAEARGGMHAPCGVCPSPSHSHGGAAARAIGMVRLRRVEALGGRMRKKVRMVICTRVQSASGLLACQRITAIYRVEGEALWFSRHPRSRQGCVVVFEARLTDGRAGEYTYLWGGEEDLAMVLVLLRVGELLVGGGWMGRCRTVSPLSPG